MEHHILVADAEETEVFRHPVDPEMIFQHIFLRIKTTYFHSVAVEITVEILIYVQLYLSTLCPQNLDIHDLCCLYHNWHCLCLQSLLGFLNPG